MTTYEVTVNGETHSVTLVEKRGNHLSFTVGTERYSAEVQRLRRETSPLGATPSLHVAATTILPTKTTSVASANEVRSPMPGIVSEVRVKVGELIEAGATVAIIEAMKMENPIRATRAGTVAEVHVTKAQEIGSGTLLISFKKTSVMV